MSTAFDAIFDNTQAEATPAPLPTEPPPVEAPPIAEEAAPEQAAEIAPEAAPPEPTPDKQERFVPLAAVLDERDKRKAAEAELARYRDMERQQPQADIPDPYDDPAGYSAFVSNAFQQHTLAVKFDLSEEMAKQAHGNEPVEAAKEWALQRAGQDAAFKQQMMTSRHPIDWAVRQHQQARDQELLQTDPVAFARQILERNGQAPVTDAAMGAVPVAGQQPPAPPRPTPPRSIASAPSSGGSAREVAGGPLAAVDALFNR